FILVAGAAATPIRSYDFFWHLATGRWIVEHRACPVYDPFTLAAAHVPWINGEWLWEVVAYGIESHVGLRGVSFVNALFVGAIFGLAFWFSASDIGAALLISAAAFLGASDRLGVRPAAAAALLIVCALALLQSKLTPMRLATAYAMLTIIWINTHPSALLAPIVAAATLLIDIRRWIVVAASAVALLINPFGWRAIVAPFELTKLVGSGEFVNAEWLPSSPSLFPLLYATAAVVIVAFFASREKKANLWRLAIFVLLAGLAIQHVRNQSLYFAALPLLMITPRLTRNASIVCAITAILPIGWAYAHSDHATGFDAERFPVRAVAHLPLPGNIYNADQFGGYLEWVFYPQRRVLTDGRNELFRDFIALDAQARRDSRVWHSLLQKYRIDLAVDEYQSERIEVVDVASGTRRFLPASLVRYRRRDWALIAFDDAAMVFARRAAFSPQAIANLEYRFLVPDDPHIGYLNDEIRNRARAEVERAKREFGNIAVVQRLEEGTR
ncbi:MAG: hypothetical protein DMF59_08270, partial [Acidobacteria bacterium]